MRYLWVTEECTAAGPCCTLQLQEELSQLSFQTLYSIIEQLLCLGNFWSLSENILTMLDKQVSCAYLNCSESVTS